MKPRVILGIVGCISSILLTLTVVRTDIAVAFGVIILFFISWHYGVLSSTNEIVRGCLTVFAMVGMAVLVAIRAISYQEQLLKNNGIWTKGVVDRIWYGKRSRTVDGRHIDYQYEVNHKSYSSWTENADIKIGDTLLIRASIEDPDIHEAYSHSMEPVE